MPPKGRDYRRELGLAQGRMWMHEPTIRRPGNVGSKLSIGAQ